MLITGSLNATEARRKNVNLQSFTPSLKWWMKSAKREKKDQFRTTSERQSLADVIEMFCCSVCARLINGKTRWAFRENRSNLSLSSAVRFIISHDLDIYGWHFISLDRKISLSSRRHEDFWLSRNSRIARFFWSCWLAIFTKCKLNS